MITTTLLKQSHPIRTQFVLYITFDLLFFIGDYAKNTSPQKYYKPFEKRQIIPNADKEQFNDFLSDQSKLSPVSINTDLLSDQVLSGYSTREESTDSDFESRKGSVFSDDSSYPAESDEDSVKHMREIIDQKVSILC